MKKNICFAAALVAGFSFASAAMAQDSILSLDVRPTAASIAVAPAAPFTLGQDAGGTASNGGGRGQGQILRLNPQTANGFHTTFGTFDPDGDLSTGSLYLYAEMNDKAGDGDVLSSLGIDFNTQDSVASGSVGGETRIASIGFAFDANGLWDGTADGASDAGDPPSVLGCKAVRVPVAAGPIFDATLGLQPSDGLTRIGELSVQASDNPNCADGAATANQTFEIFMSPNNLLNTRAWDPNNPGSGPEMIAFGYDNLGANYAAGTGATDAAISGESVGAQSALPDAVVRIQIKGDGTGNGFITGQDIPLFSALLQAQVAASQSTVYSYDFNGSGSITGQDVPGFSAALQAGAPSCP